MNVNKEMLLQDIKKIPGLVLAFFICAYGIAQVKVLNFGMAPWDTLVLGINSKTGIEFGKLTQAIGIIIILFSIIIKIYPGIGTVLNITFIGFFVDLISKFNILLVPENFILKLITLVYGLIVLNYGLYSYLKYELGAGPRDGLMVGLVKITGLDVKYVRTGIESIVLAAGYLLGGTVGIGTVISTFSGGYILDKIFQWKKFDARSTSQRKLSDYLTIDKRKTETKA